MTLLKRGVILAAACAMAAALAACGGRSASGADGAAPEPSAQTQSAETEAVSAETPEAPAETPAAEEPQTQPAASEPAGAPEAAVIPAEAAGQYCFSSGAGGWSTELTLNADGTFEGHFHDSDMGDTGEDYPNGTIYFCDFHGRFANVRAVDETTWSMTMEELEVTSGFDYEAYVEDGVRWVPSTPYGCESEPGTTFYLYSPDHSPEGFEDEFLRWIEPWFLADPRPDTFGVWVIHNTTGDYGFYEVG